MNEFNELIKKKNKGMKLLILLCNTNIFIRT